MIIKVHLILLIFLISLMVIKVNYFVNLANVLYSTSKRIDSRIISEDQITQELLIIPTTILMNLIQMKVNYTCNGQNRSINILLPNTVLKFTSFKDITATDLSKKMDQRKSSIFRTDPFKLSKHFPPKVVKKNL